MSPAMAQASSSRYPRGYLPSSIADAKSPLLPSATVKRKGPARCHLKARRCAHTALRLALLVLIYFIFMTIMGFDIGSILANASRRIGLLVLSWFAVTGHGATFTPILPPSYPLAVRNPYLSAWLPGNLAADLPTATPQFWNQNPLTWSVIAQVDEQIYNLFGVSSPYSSSKDASVVSGSFTSTHSTFVLSAGNAEFTLDFFSPVSVTDFTRQSLPFSYLTVTSTGTSGKSPNIRLYSDIDDTWTGQSSNTLVQHSLTNGTSVFTLKAQGTAEYSQNNEMALWGEAVYASRATSDYTLSSSSGSASSVRGQFYGNGSLTGNYQIWSTGAVVGFAADLGSVSSTKVKSVTFAVGHYREDAINYLGEPQTHYYRAQYSTPQEAVSYFLDDYDDALAESKSFDSTVDEGGVAVGGSNYSDILALSVRQIFGGIDVTISKSTLDTENVWAFIKEISSDGNLNTMDIIMPTFPFFYIFAPQYIKMFCEPILQYVTSGRYNEDYMIHDIGFHYPNATGHDLSMEEKMPVEETGNMLVLALAYQVATGDKSWAESYADKFKIYADYLVDNGLYPPHQLSTNDGIGAFTNMTNLAVKAAVGLTAYGELTGDSSYTNKGKQFADTIWTDGLGTATSDNGDKYFTITYTDDAWFLIFNVYPDKLLSLDTFPEETFKAQSDFYPTVRQPAGVALEGHIQWAKTDWQMWVAATSEADTQEIFVNDLWAFIANGLNTAPFGDRYWSGGSSAGHTAEGFRARPTLGAHFAIWALKKGPNSG